jgi:hypothetical protein
MSEFMHRMKGRLAAASFAIFFVSIINQGAMGAESWRGDQQWRLDVEEEFE